MTLWQSIGGLMRLRKLDQGPDGNESGETLGIPCREGSEHPCADHIVHAI